MRFLVFGAGAVGSLVAARLAQHYSVSLVARDEHVRAIRERGLLVTGRTEIHARNIEAAASVAELRGPHPDVVLVTVKSYQTLTAREALEPFWSRSLFVSLQNGLGNEETLAERCSRVLGAVINQGAIFVEPGKVFHAGEDETWIGPFSGTTANDSERVARSLDESGIRARAVSGAELREAIWKKVVLNAAVNPLTALLGKKTGELLENVAIDSAIRAIVEESVAIARASGVALEEGPILEWIRRVAEATRENKSSMLQDVERGRPTEIDSMNGALVERARALGIPSPRNELLTLLVRSLADPAR
jgi:2-dehydropantoate 2-reductase